MKTPRANETGDLRVVGAAKDRRTPPRGAAKARPSAKVKSAPVRSVKLDGRAALRTAVACVIPWGALGATAAAGSLFSVDEGVAAGLVALIAVGVYATSVPHVALGLRRVAHLSTVQAALLACAVDGAVVAGEIVRMRGGDELSALAWALMLGGVALSMPLNAVGFVKARSGDPDYVKKAR